MQLLRNLSLAFALGAVFFAVSESLFWSFWKPSDTASELFQTYIFYALATYAFLILIEKYKIRTLGGLVLTGALYGWIIEGIIVPEVYTMLPYSIVHTSLSWHMLITILFGYYWLPKRLITNQSVLYALIGFGILWSVYGIYPGSDIENSGWVISAMAFTTHTLFTIACWMIGLFAFIHLKPALFKASKIEVYSILIIFLGLYGVLIFATAFLALILLPFLLLTFYILHRRQKILAVGDNILDFWSAPSPLTSARILMIGIPGAVASMVFALLYLQTGSQDIAWPFFLITFFVAIGFYIRALWKS